MQVSNSNKLAYPIAQRLFAMRPLHMQRGCFRIRTHDQQVTKAQLYRCTRARPLLIFYKQIINKNNGVKSLIFWVKLYKFFV